MLFFFILGVIVILAGAIAGGTGAETHNKTLETRGLIATFSGIGIIALTVLAWAFTESFLK
jgi:hypothetical protein